MTADWRRAPDPQLSDAIEGPSLIGIASSAWLGFASMLLALEGRVLAAGARSAIACALMASHVLIRFRQLGWTLVELSWFVLGALVAVVRRRARLPGERRKQGGDPRDRVLLVAAAILVSVVALASAR